MSGFISYLGSQFVFRTSLLRNSPCDRYRSEGDSKPQVFGFLLEPLDLLVLITLLIIFHPFVYVLLAVFEHAIDQPRQVVGHSRDRLRGAEFCAQPLELGPQIAFTAPQSWSRPCARPWPPGSRHDDSHGDIPCLR